MTDWPYVGVNTQYPWLASRGAAARKLPGPLPNNPCAVTTGRGCAADGRHDQSLTPPEAAWAGVERAMVATAAAVRARRTRFMRNSSLSVGTGYPADATLE